MSMITLRGSGVEVVVLGNGLVLVKAASTRHVLSRLGVMDGPRWVPRRKAARELGVSVKRVDTWIREGRLRARRADRTEARKLGLRVGRGGVTVLVDMEHALRVAE